MLCIHLSVIPATAPEKHLVSGGSDSRIIIWEAQDEKVPFLLQIKAPNVWCPDWTLRHDVETGLLLLSSASSQWSAKAILVPFVRWMPSMWRSRTFWWPLQHLTPLSGCGSAASQRKVKKKKKAKHSIHLLKTYIIVNFLANFVLYYVELCFCLFGWFRLLLTGKTK